MTKRCSPEYSFPVKLYSYPVDIDFLENTDIETRHLKIFVSVYKHRSFTKAAEELYTSQPTVSEHIQNLETHLNCKLFDRLGRTILPTPEAELLFQRARTILDDLQQLEEDITTSQKIVSGKVIIGASTIPGTYLLPRLAAAFKQQFPKISFEIRINDSATTVDLVANHELYLGVVGAKLQNSKVTYQPLSVDELILVAAGSAKVDDTISLEQLATLPFINREIGSGTRKSTEAHLSEHNFTPKKLQICATLGSTAAVKEAIKADMGVSILSKLAVEDELASSSLRQIQIGDFEMQRSFYLVTPLKRTLPNNYQQLIKSLLAS